MVTISMRSISQFQKPFRRIDPDQPFLDVDVDADVTGHRDQSFAAGAVEDGQQLHAAGAHDFVDLADITAADRFHAAAGQLPFIKAVWRQLYSFLDRNSDV